MYCHKHHVRLDVFHSLTPILPYGVVPQENSIFGNVIETYDLLKDTDVSFIRGEITLKVQHCLVARTGTKLHEINHILSHEQLVKTASTAAAAQQLQGRGHDSAAICSSICATLFDGLEVLQHGIQNEASHTRQTAVPPALSRKCEMKALLRISAPSPSAPPIAGSCSYDIMKFLKTLDLFATRIDRRPSTHALPFHSTYFVEVHGHSRECVAASSLEDWTLDVEKAISRVQKIGGDIKLVGLW
ncbi:hypothetical protein BJ165DRAFT_496740 [Panaeolus papilionaceus]|nr:hypothetical protein BJ165DRAFT_496740 [Panaeolus papilionaceus]